MKGITDIDNMSVQRWYKLHNSIENGEPDWSLLYENKPTNVNKLHAEKLYQDLIFQMPEIKAESLFLLLRLNQETEEFIIKSKLHEFYNEEKPSPQKCENAFGAYFLSIEKDFQNFISYTYHLKSDYKESFKSEFGFDLPEQLDKDFSDKFSFMHPHQLIEYANSLDCTVSQKVLISDIFFDKFIVKVKSNISLRDYLESLKEYHIRVDGYDKWLMLRPHLFNFADFETETGNEKHFTVSKMYEIIFGLEQFSKVQINPQNDSIVKFNTYLNLANKQAESSKPTAQ